MRIDNVNEKCTGCGACVTICPTNAIEMKKDEEGFEYPYINEEKCVNCSKCYKYCHAINKKEKPTFQKAYYGRCKDDRILNISSSGGIYYPIAKKVEDIGGIVYGAVLEKENWRVEHLSNKERELKEQIGSKYVQSSTYKSFRKIKEELERGKKILFSGTPCQIAGLKRLVGENQNLYTIDLICHGVPSPKVLEDKIKLLEEKEKSKLIELKFRSKIGKWSQYKLYTKYDNKRIKLQYSGYDDYFKLFFHNYSLRKSCYECQYSDEQHMADITLADYWGGLRDKTISNDEKGTSLIIINTLKGNMLLEMVKDELNIEELEWNKVKYVYKTHEQYSLKNRKKFFESYIEKGYEEANKTIKIKNNLIQKLSNLKRKMFYDRISKKLSKDNLEKGE